MLVSGSAGEVSIFSALVESDWDCVARLQMLSRVVVTRIQLDGEEYECTNEHPDQLALC
jgi:hypothetical protein